MLLSPCYNLSRAAADTNNTGFFVELSTGRNLTLEEFVQAFGNNDILVFGELHAVADDLDSQTHQGNQTQLLTALHKVNLGMEFLEYPRQNFVDLYLEGFLSDGEFKKKVGWGENPFEMYKQQILAPSRNGGATWAINIPRSITKQISKQGLTSLTPAQRSYLPPHLTRGNSLYFERFAEIMSGHATLEQIERYFWAQSTWDETMAWRTLRKMRDPKSMKNYVTVVIVGAFHVEFGGGLPDRLKSRIISEWPNGNGPRVKTLLQIALPNLDPKTVQSALAPHPKYGPVSDFAWVYKVPGPFSGSRRSASDVQSIYKAFNTPIFE